MKSQLIVRKYVFSQFDVFSKNGSCEGAPRPKFIFAI